VHSWQKFKNLSKQEQRLFIRAVFILPIIAIAIRLLGLNRWQTALATLSSFDRTPVKSETIDTLGQANITARMIRTASWHGFYRANCLQESLALWWLLRRQGIESNLRFGARKAAGRIEAHAWVEFTGLPLNESLDVDRRFNPFERAVMRAEGNAE
jgi:Transglutaminase-like superfamily